MIVHSPVTTGISFAILIASVSGAFAYVAGDPIEILKDPWFGFRGSPLTPELAEVAGLAGHQGFLVMIVEDESPAEDAGLRGGNRLATVAGDTACLGGDLITEVNSTPVIGVDEIRSVLEASEVGDTIDLRVVRGENPPSNVSIRLGEDPGRPPVALEEVCR